ncbi:hypothetical protein [Alteromonas sp. CYL-A6]|uniref:hypothetical protein n=1 Tax=Alteromonas nitratireducens TaxID=3390813 RepID=UPI0034BD2555
MKGLKSSHQCPICDKRLDYFSRYPNYVCKRCEEQATDSSGRNVRYFNVGIHGGITGKYVDNDSPYEHQECFINGVKCFASDAHTGGIVIETCEFHERIKGMPVLNHERFTLSENQWYAAEIIGEEFESEIRTYSPIKVYRLDRKKSGRSLFSLHFYHANYPEGVRDKVYELQTVERTRSFILAKTTERPMTRYLLIYSIDGDWLHKHFGVELDRTVRVDEWLERNA